MRWHLVGAGHGQVTWRNRAAQAAEPGHTATPTAHLHATSTVPMPRCRNTALPSFPIHVCSETSNSMYHLAEVRWQQGQHDAAVRLMEHSLEIMEAQVGCGCCWFSGRFLTSSDGAQPGDHGGAGGCSRAALNAWSDPTLRFEPHVRVLVGLPHARVLCGALQGSAAAPHPGLGL